jgi:hypothetical protein
LRRACTGGILRTREGRVKHIFRRVLIQEALRQGCQADEEADYVHHAFVLSLTPPLTVPHPESTNSLQDKRPLSVHEPGEGNFPGISCTETQSRNQRRVGGWPGSFYTVRGDPTLRTNRRSATPPVNHTTFGRYFSPSQLPISPRTSRAQSAGRPKAEYITL